MAQARPPRFRFTLAEFSGALADLGVMLPLMVALIALNGVDATAAFVGVGLAYILVALVYRLPIPVQPLKSVASLALALGLPPVMIVAAAAWNAVTFLTLGLVRLDRLIRYVFPKPVVRGIQAGLAWLLLRTAWRLARTPAAGWEDTFRLGSFALPTQAVLLTLAALVLAVFLLGKRDWAALALVLFGVGASVWRHGMPDLTLNLHLPRLLPLLPTPSQMVQAFGLLALPQIPLSLGNSVYATADAARVYFGEQARHVTERKLMLTLGASDALIAALGGVPVCHGCGGLTAHYRLGARTGAAPLMIGTLFLLLGLLGGDASTRIIGLLPLPVLAVLLAYVAVQHALLLRDVRGVLAWSTALLVPALTLLTGNLAVGFGVAALGYHACRWLATRCRRWAWWHLPSPSAGD